MKTRNGFVSNSSSSSFIIGAAKVLDEKTLLDKLFSLGIIHIFNSESAENEFKKSLTSEGWDQYWKQPHNIDLYICTKADIPTSEYVDGINRIRKKPRDYSEPYHPTNCFYLNEWDDLIIKAMTNDKEECLVYLKEYAEDGSDIEHSPNEKYLIASLHHGEDDGPFLRKNFEGLDTSVVNDAYFEKNFPKSFEILQLLMGKENVTEPLKYLFGVSRLG